MCSFVLMKLLKTEINERLNTMEVSPQFLHKVLELELY